MKTAISVPNPLFEAAEALARRLGVSRSELYSRALADFVTLYSEDEIVEKLDEIYAEEDSSLDPALMRMQSSSITDEGW
jgi:predicted transcriptional regulator